MISDRILPLLDKVKRKGDNSWLACCPAHDDKNPSLAVTEKDGTVLLYCFSHHCSAADIVHAVGLEYSDLYPEQIKVEGSKPIRKKRFPAEAILEALAEEFVIAEIGLAALSNGGTLNEKAQARMKEASNRFTSARIAGGWL